MKITIRHPAGLEIQFEGEPPEFDRFTSFLTELPAFVGTLGKTPVVGTSLPAALAQGDGGAAAADLTSGAVLGGLDPQDIMDRLDAVGATTDIERVTVIAQVAEDAGLGGADYPLVERVYRDIGIPAPPKLRATFSNAKQKGYVQSKGQGRWATTVRGRNFALHGTRAPTGRRGRRASSVSSTGGGGDED